MNRISLLKVFVLLALLLSTTRVLADSECTHRALTAAEKNFYGLFSKLRAALPKPPAGWRFSSSSQELMAAAYTGIPDHLCKESTGHWLTEVFDYERMDDGTEQATLQKAQALAPDPAKLAEVAKLNEQQAILTEQMMAASSKGDMAKLDKLGAESEALSKRVQKMMDQLYAPQTAALAGLDRDRSARVTITVNGKDAGCAGQPRSEKAAGAMVYHCAYDNGYTDGGEILDPAAARVVMVFGKSVAQTSGWSRLDHEQHEFQDSDVAITMAYDESRSLVVQNIVVSIDADNAARVEQLYKAMSPERLQALVKQ